MIVSQHNAWIHAAATAGVVIAGIFYHVSPQEWALLVCAISLVWMTEAMNTALEFLADEVSEEKRLRIGKAKDIAAFAVLITAVASAIIGSIVFLPYIFVKK